MQCCRCRFPRVLSPNYLGNSVTTGLEVSHPVILPVETRPTVKVSAIHILPTGSQVWSSGTLRIQAGSLGKLPGGRAVRRKGLWLKPGFTGGEVGRALSQRDQRRGTRAGSRAGYLRAVQAAGTGNTGVAGECPGSWALDSERLPCPATHCRVTLGRATSLPLSPHL